MRRKDVGSIARDSIPRQETGKGAKRKISAESFFSNPDPTFITAYIYRSPSSLEIKCGYYI